MTMAVLAYAVISCGTESISEDQDETLIQETISERKPVKVDICHYSESDDTWHIINVNVNAVPAHLGHGDIQLIDLDGDGFVAQINECVPGGDCDDNNATVNPDATEICDGVDNNCDGNIDEGFDVDADGYTTCQGDCDDNDASINPGVTEQCDGIDNNCDGNIDEGFDSDGDGYTSCEGDCDDANAAINPGAEEVCGNGIDDDCDGENDEDCGPAIGDFHAGGIVFWLDESGQHGFVCTVSDQGRTRWGCHETRMAGADGSIIGTGAQNTLDILNGCSTPGIAARLCADLDLNGYSDWFLPSIDELSEMYLNKDIINTTASSQGGSDFNIGWYFSSTQLPTGAGQALGVLFTDGSARNIRKINVYNVRAVRAF